MGIMWACETLLATLRDGSVTLERWQVARVNGMAVPA
jgi:hypothetical protein